MNYYKVIINDIIVDAGHTFLRWVDRNHFFLECGIEEAEFVQSTSGEIIWRDTWMNKVLSNEPVYELAEIVIVDEEEYNELRKSLDANLHLEVTEDVPPVDDVAIIPEDATAEDEIKQPSPIVMSDERARVLLAKLYEALVEKGLADILGEV